MTTVAAREIPLGWRLPAAPYVPGVTARHREDEPLFAVAAAAPAETLPDRWAENAAWLGGLELFARGYFWEAHELWEPVWMNARPNSRERALVRGLIQVANACLKLRMDRPRAARRLLAEACDHLAEATGGAAPARLLGLDGSATAAATAAFRDRLAADGATTAIDDRPDYRRYMQHNA